MHVDRAFLERLNSGVEDFHKRTGMSLQGIAQQLGCHWTTLHQYLDGVSTIPEHVLQNLMRLIALDEHEHDMLLKVGGYKPLKLSQPPTRSSLDSYLNWLEREYGYTPPLGIADEHVQLDLQQVHVPLRVVERDTIIAYRKRMLGEQHDGSGAEGRNDRRASVEQRKSGVFALLSEPGHGEAVTTRRLLLLGEAGSGKTMTLRYGALRLVAAYRTNDVDQLANPSTGLHMRLQHVPVPIYVRLTLFAATLPTDRLEDEHDAARSPDRFLKWIDLQAAQDCGLPEGVLSELIQRDDGGALLLFDGLDETGEHQRIYMAQLISQLARRYPTLRYLVASRTAGYGGIVTLPDFLERHLSPLDTQEIQALIHNWFHTVYARLATIGRRRQESAADQAAQLWSFIARNGRLIDMATNPLLLTAIVLLQFNRVNLPDQRAKLYEKLTDLLLELWRKQNIVGSKPMSEANLASERRRLETLALEMQQQQQQVREVTLLQAQEWLSPLYRIDRQMADARVKDLLHRLSVNSGIIQRRDEHYSFAHYTFQEYLAARALDSLDNRRSEENSVTFLLERSGNPRWRETLLLAAGSWSSGHQLPKTERLLEGLLAKQEAESLLLAATALVDVGMIEELTHLYAEVTRRLRALAALSNDWIVAAHPDPVVRNHAAILLDQLNADSDRPGLNLIKADYWAARIEPGRFRMGDDHSQYADEYPQFDCTIRRPYALARFPVTNRHYLLFLEALAGRGVPVAVAAAQELLSQMVQHKQTLEQLRPYDWTSAHYRIGEGNYPVVGVSWYAATAFAWWVDAWLHTLGLLAPDEKVRLPTEAEWERAAAYPVLLPDSGTLVGRRVYPWGSSIITMMGGNIMETIQANIDASQIGGRSVVGIFPHGAATCGAEELAGNIWEWCSTPYLNYPLADGVHAESLHTNNRSDTIYALRGGSWGLGRTRARCACRLVINLGRARAGLGFRLARLFSPS